MKRHPSKKKPKRRFAGARGSAARHVGIWIQTRKGNFAHILADPGMCQKTADALAEMIDAAGKAAAAGTLKPPNDQAQRPE